MASGGWREDGVVEGEEGKVGLARGGYQPLGEHPAAVQAFTAKYQGISYLRNLHIENSQMAPTAMRTYNWTYPTS